MKPNILLCFLLSGVIIVSCGNKDSKTTEPTLSNQDTLNTNQTQSTDWAEVIASETGTSIDSLFTLTKEFISNKSIYKSWEKYSLLGEGVMFEANGDLKKFEPKNKNLLWTDCGTWSFQNDILTVNIMGEQKKIAVFSSGQSGVYWVLMDIETKELAYYDYEVGG